MLSVSNVPVANSRLYEDCASAIDVPTADVELVRCDHCGFVQNDVFEPSLVTYDDGYEDSQGHSPYFIAFAERVIRELLERYELGGRRVLEIGCGRGDFLRMYCNLSGSTGVGLDPSATREAGPDGRVEVRAESFVAGSGHFDADVVVCRHTLEHVPEVDNFLRTIRTEFESRDVVLYLEIPDSARIAAEGAFWDIYYEHCGYFDVESLTGLLHRTGWEPLECRLDYAGQYLVAHARPSATASDRARSGAPIDFGRVARAMSHWRSWASELERDGRRAAVWAATSKSVAFMSGVPAFRPIVATDVNPAKWGRYLPGSGLAVCSPEQLSRHEIDTIVVMNPVYLDEITTQLRTLGIDATIVALHG